MAYRALFAQVSCRPAKNDVIGIATIRLVRIVIVYDLTSSMCWTLFCILDWINVEKGVD